MRVVADAHATLSSDKGTVTNMNIRTNLKMLNTGNPRTAPNSAARPTTLRTNQQLRGFDLLTPGV
jgi:hypothetical protein